MEVVEGELADIDGLRIRMRVAPQVDAAAPAPGSRHAPEYRWKHFIEESEWPKVEESMRVLAYAKKLASKGMQALRVSETEPDHVKLAALYKEILHAASAETADPAVARALLNIAAAYPSALSKLAAKNAEQHTKSRIDVASLSVKPRACQEALRERLQELKEETARYQRMHMELCELKQTNKEVEASLEGYSNQLVTLVENHVAPSTIKSATEGESCHAVAILCNRVQKTIRESQAARHDMEEWFREKLALRFEGAEDPISTMR